MAAACCVQVQSYILPGRSSLHSYSEFSAAEGSQLGYCTRQTSNNRIAIPHSNTLRIGRCHLSSSQHSPASLNKQDSRSWSSVTRCSHGDAKTAEQSGEGRQREGAGANEGILRSLARGVTAAALCLTLATSVGVLPAEAKRREGVNKPELLPEEFTRVIDAAGFLSAGQEERLNKDLERLERDTGYKLRVLAQNYPETPGLAVKEYWDVDDSTVVFVADPSLSGNILNFNVGTVVDLAVPRSFWSRLSGKYGNMFYWKEQGEDTAIENAIIAIDACLREPQGPRQCAQIKGSD